VGPARASTRWRCCTSWPGSSTPIPTSSPCSAAIREWILDEIESRLVAERGPAERDDAMQRAALLLSLAEHAPAGHGLADSAVAAYDEAVAQLLDPED
jgi:hypothetical protein